MAENNQQLEARLERIEAMLMSLMDQLDLSPDDQPVTADRPLDQVVPPTEIAPAGPPAPQPGQPAVMAPNYEYNVPEEFQIMGVIWSPEIGQLADNYERQTGETMVRYFLPDLPGFNEKTKHYRQAIEEIDGLNDFQKATYWFTMRGAAVMNFFLSKRREYYVSKVVPAGYPGGKGRAEYDHQATGQKHPACILVPNVTTAAEAEEWLKAKITGSLDAWRRAKEKAGQG